MNKLVNSDMIVLAREAREMTQRDLAEAIGVTQGKVSKYENGILQVSHDDLTKIARVTGFTSDFFFQTDKIYGLGHSMLFHRQRQDVPMLVQKKIQAEVNVCRMQLDRLLRGAEIESENRIEPLDVENYDGGPEEVAQILRASWKVPLGPIKNLTRTIEGAGVIIVRCDFGTKGVDGVHLWPPGMPPMFFLNAHAPTDRDRFNLAHELGHAVMHRFPTGNIEDEANRFAAEFLMPAAEIAVQLEGLTIEKAARLKPYWRVSMAAIIKRAADLNKITERQYRSLFTRLSALGYRTNEPITLEAEEPTLAPQLVGVYKEMFGYSDDEMKRLLFSANTHAFKLLETLPPPVNLTETAYPFLRYKHA